MINSLAESELFFAQGFYIGALSTWKADTTCWFVVVIKASRKQEEIFLTGVS